MISTVTTSTITTTTTVDIMGYSIIAVVALIVFLALKEIMSSEAHKNTKIARFIQGSNVAILPLLFVFLSVVAYKVATIL
ncbi:MAG: hypothetical protein ACXVZU_01885, partial [Methanobacteriaceae archaeon]